MRANSLLVFEKFFEFGGLKPALHVGKVLFEKLLEGFDLNVGKLLVTGEGGEKALHLREGGTGIVELLEGDLVVHILYG